MPRHANALFSPATWYCKYLNFVKIDGVEPEPEEFFFRAIEGFRFKKKRLGYKKFGLFWKEAAVLNGYDAKHFSGLLKEFCELFFVFSFQDIQDEEVQLQFLQLVVLHRHMFKLMERGQMQM